jgi:broad specificity phosphatase PhoE
MSEKVRKMYLVRHGESVWNVQRRVQGNSMRNALSKKGKRQSRLLGEKLRSMEFDSVYCSNVERAVETAGIALGDSATPNYMEELREVSFGNWEGRLINEIKKDEPGELEKWFHKPASVSIKGAEDLFSFRERVVGAFEKIVRGGNGGDILVISHGGVICVYLTHLLGMSLDDMWAFSLPNASITLIVLDYRPRLRLFGDTSHLDAAALGFDGMPSVYDT